MPSLVLHPRAASAGKLRVWLGVFNADEAPDEIKWDLDGKAASAASIRPLTAAHTSGSRTYTGIFELDDDAHGTERRLRVSAVGHQSASLDLRAVPSAVPSDEWFRLLLTSCYHQDEDRRGLAAQTFENIPAATRPDLTLMMGDQVYLDLPTLNNFPDDEAKLAKKFEQAYRKNWTADNGLTKLLSAAPSISSPDDHEYWNNFPHSSPIIQNSWKADSQSRWKNAADQLYDAFQLSASAKRGDNFEIDIDPFSVMVLDQRTKRRDDRLTSLAPGGLQQLNDWVDRLIEQKKFGAVVTGQSLLDKPVSKFVGTVADWMLPNYEDFEEIVQALARLADAGRPVLLLTGDVHWGRVTRVRQDRRTKFIEIICSPTSLVTTVGADQRSAIGAGFRRIFWGKKTRWPRHSEAPNAEPYFAPQVFGKRFRTETIHKQQGNQLAMLALRQAASTMEAKVTYYEIHKAPKDPKEVYLGLLRNEK